MLRRRSTATGIDATIVTMYFGSLNLTRTIRNGTTHRDCRADGQRGIDATTRHHDWRRDAIRLDEAKRIRMQGREVEGAAGSARPLMDAGGAADGASARLPVHAGFVFVMQEARQEHGLAGFERREDNPAAGWSVSVDAVGHGCR